MSHCYRILDPAHHEVVYAGKCALAVMAKAPVPGKVKTRLIPPLSPQQAAELNACFLRDTVANLAEAAHFVPAEVAISYTPVGAEEAFTGILPEGMLLLPQRGDGFGERLLGTATDLFACGFSAVCLIDSDSPTVPRRQFLDAAENLLRSGSRAVIGSSCDGGYYLIGLQAPEPHLFAGIDWSTDVVAAQTLERAAEIGLPVVLLAEWYDVDDAASLDRLCGELNAPGANTTAGYAAPHTRQFLQSLAAARRGSDTIERFA